jgi:L-ascorbate metabolism protein UlaG (beta-lactamase superfamily)
MRAAILPIAPFRPPQSANMPSSGFSQVHMGPAEAVQAHRDLRAGSSVAAHFQVFQLGWDGFDDAPNRLKEALTEQGLPPDTFIAPIPGRPFAPAGFAGKSGPADLPLPGRELAHESVRGSAGVR